MKKKNILAFLSTIIAIFSVFSFYNLVYASTSSCGDKVEQVDLHGSLAQTTLRSSSSPFEVIKGSDSLSIYYLQDLDNINIEIFNEFGQSVYSNRVISRDGGNLCIDISTWMAGKYRIYFNNSLGNSIYGDFIIEKRLHSKI